MERETAVQGFPGVTITVGNRGKQPDYGWGGPPHPPDYGRKPTVVLEVAVSESKAKLERDVEFWLDPSVLDSPLIIPFEILMRRPSSSPLKTNVSIGMQDLKGIAEGIFAQDFRRGVCTV
ncbi:uncharacterized protein N7518_003774 [Penicillium psychrosexuale]|uniref:uncharacterized protein n=1 Tax=Penicillium psychrosexuale TaxID=1002107 RepID=UPI002545854C|nr:uncharacterized protein N7518_003774 [Penicillium psychrosexuale]KAJ5801706.1 hypothetical protein N7518_003774 [Penicillium psychrosexuale]